MRIVWDANNLKVQLGFWESRILDLKRINIIRIFDISINDGQIGLLSNLVGSNDNSGVI